MQRNDPTSCSMAGRDMSLAAFEDRKRKRNEMKKKQENREKDRKIVFKQLSLKIIAVVFRTMICHLKNAAVKLLVHQKKSSRKKDKFKANRNIRSRDSTGPSQCK